MSNEIQYEILSCLDKISLNFNNEYLVHSNVVVGNHFDKSTNSIILENGIIENHMYETSNLLSECSSLGQKLYKLYEDSFTLYFPSSINTEEGIIEFEHLLLKKGFPNIKDEKNKQLLDLFLIWSTNYGLPIQPKIAGIETDSVLELKELKILRDKFIILHLLYDFYYSYLFIANENTTYRTEESKRYTWKKSIEKINKLGKILFPNFQEIDTCILKLDTINKMKQFENNKKSLVELVNYYSNQFQISIQLHLVHRETKCKIIYISNNIFDLAWNSFLNSLQFSEKQNKPCADCGLFYVASKHSFRCPDCRKLYNASSNSQNQKNQYIEDIINKSSNISISDKKLLQDIEEIKTLNEKGNSRAKYKYSKTKIEEVLKQLESYINKMG